MTTDLGDILRSGKKLLFVGIGNLLKHDDGIGVYLANNIRETDTIKRMVVEMSIEKYVGAIEREDPDILILIDAVDLQRRAGDFVLVEAGNILDQTTHTHNISLRRIAEFFKMPVYVLGIQPQDLSYGEGYSEEVREGADKVVKLINSAQTF